MYGKVSSILQFCIYFIFLFIFILFVYILYCINFVFAHSYRLITDLCSASESVYFLIDHSTTFLGTLSNAFFRITSHMYYFCLASYSCNIFEIKIKSNVPFSGIKPNCIPSIVIIFLNLFLSVSYTIFTACSCNFTPLYMRLFTISPSKHILRPYTCDCSQYLPLNIFYAPIHASVHNIYI